jgi:hypothetical protein
LALSSADGLTTALLLRAASSLRHFIEFRSTGVNPVSAERKPPLRALQRRKWRSGHLSPDGGGAPELRRLGLRILFETPPSRE